MEAARLTPAGLRPQKSRRSRVPGAAVLLATLAATAATLLCSEGTLFAAKSRHIFQRKIKIPVVLLRDHPDLGKKGEIVKVKRGHYRNWLLPKGSAVRQDPDLLRKLQAEETAAEEQRREGMAEALGMKGKIEREGTYRFTKKVRPDSEKIYGSLTAADVVGAIKELTGVQVRVTAVSVPKVQELGEYSGTVEISEEVTAYIKVQVLPEGAAGGGEDEEES
mmetsp:Transcript_21412/g.61987  ORF Transcript_21412/g.61987 Transcript_21412/m.61987 type:complete len:221 (-) Transcript_21412:74-736(-)